MPIDSNRKQTLYDLVQDFWKEVQAALLVYERSLRRNKAKNEVMQWGTICSALITAASSYFSFSWVTILAGMLTALLAAVDKTFAPSKNMQSFYDCRSKIEVIKKDFVTCAIAIENDSLPNFDAAMSLANQIYDRFRTEAKIPYVTAPVDKQSASKLFEDTVIFRIIQRQLRAGGAAAEAAEVDPMELKPEESVLEDALGIVAIPRPVRVIGR